MKKINKIFTTLLASLIALMAMMVPAAAAGTSTKDPYVRSWIDYTSNYTVIDYYEYNQTEQGYMKTSTVNYVDANAYYKTTKTKLSETLYDEQIGFDVNGNVLFINTDKNVYGVLKNGNTAQTIASNATELAYDNNGFVIGYYGANGNLINITSPTTSSSSGSSSSSSSSSSSTSSGSTSWNSGSSSSSSSGWNTGSSSSSSSSTTSSSFPYITKEDGKLILVEATDVRNELYVDEDNQLLINNISLFKHGVKSYGYYKEGVIFITNSNRVVVWKYTTKKTYVVAKKGSSLNVDSNGYVVSYTTTNGKTVSL